MKKLLLLLMIPGITTLAFAQHTETVLNKTIINKLFTCTLDKMLDTVAQKYHLNIVFERDSLSKFDVVEHFFLRNR